MKDIRRPVNGIDDGFHDFPFYGSKVSVLGPSLFNPPDIGIDGEICHTPGGGCSPRKMAALRRANASKVVGFIPKTSQRVLKTLDSLPLRLSAKSSSRASIRNSGIPLARRPSLAFSGLTLK